jgi:hypothetical protein
MATLEAPFHPKAPQLERCPSVAIRVKAALSAYFCARNSTQSARVCRCEIDRRVPHV